MPTAQATLKVNTRAACLQGHALKHKCVNSVIAASPHHKLTLLSSPGVLFWKILLVNFFINESKPLIVMSEKFELTSLPLLGFI